MEVSITSMQGTHTFRRDRTRQVIQYNPWSIRLHSHPTIIKKMKTYLELKGKLGPKSQSQPNQFRPPQPNTQFPCKERIQSNGKKKKIDSHKEIQSKGSSQA